MAQVNLAGADQLLVLIHQSMETKVNRLVAKSHSNTCPCETSNAGHATNGAQQQPWSGYECSLGNVLKGILILIWHHGRLSQDKPAIRFALCEVSALLVCCCPLSNLQASSFQCELGISSKAESLNFAEVMLRACCKISKAFSAHPS